jgi:putative Mg2+ transporter-C (MgtC) family protein
VLVWYSWEMPPEATVIVRVLLGTALGFVLGFERGLRGSPAGDRTFSLIGAAAAAVTAVSYQHSPQTVAGIITGIGFIGGGVVFHGEDSLIRGITTAAAVFVMAAIGILVGTGDALAAIVLTLLVLLVLEVGHLRMLRWFDAQYYQGRFKQDSDGPRNPPE